MLRGVEKMGFADIEGEIVKLGTKAKDGSLTVEDMVGGTFSITNGGVFGSLMWSSWWREGPLAPSEDTAPCARPVAPKAQPAPMHPEAPSRRLAVA